MAGCLVTLVAGLLSALAGATTAGALGVWITRVYHVSDFEGGRGMAIAFLFIPAGFVFGAVTGLVLARPRLVPTSGAFARRVALGLTVTVGTIAGMVGLAWLAADKPPTIAGQPLAVEFEVEVPQSRLPAGSLEDALYVSLFASKSDNHLATLRFDALTRTGTHVVVPGTADLRSRSPTRSLLVSTGSWPSDVFDLSLRAHPSRKDMEWTGWSPAARRADGSPLTGEPIQLRYRVRIAR